MIKNKHIKEINTTIDSEFVKQAKDIPVANISDCMDRLVGSNSGLKPIHLSEKSLVGRAFTVKVAPGDNLYLHKALDLASENDVIVVDAGGQMNNAIMGELMVAYAKTRKIAGIIIHGAIRDVVEIQKMDFMVYALGVTHRGPYKNGPGEINSAISLDGMVVNAGDLIVADRDGVVCIPFDNIKSILEAAKNKNLEEQQTLKNIKAGKWHRSWLKT